MLIATVTGPGLEEAKRQINKANQACDGVELRLDLIGECPVAELLSQIQGVSILTPEQITPSLFTYHPDYLSLPWDYKGTIPPSKTKIIRTYHNFEDTPDDLEKIYRKIPPADVVKIACMTRKTTDAMRMLLFAKEKENFIVVGMGELGRCTRVLGPVIGNVFDFASIEEPTAPGQMSVESLCDIYNYPFLSDSSTIYGLIGNPISQSPSHKTHNASFKREDLNAVYFRFFLEEEELPLFLSQAKSLGIGGLSVTIPFKEALFDSIESIEEEAAKIGAINTLTFLDQRITGANTDGEGAVDALEEKQSVMGKRCIILGAGGTARAIAYEARKRGAEVTLLSRRLSQAEEVGKALDVSYGILDNLREYDILINTTPIPDPIPLDVLIPRKVVMDVNVLHAKSPMMIRAKALGCSLIYGISMFQKQAEGQFSRWFRKAQISS